MVANDTTLHLSTCQLYYAVGGFQAVVRPYVLSFQCTYVPDLGTYRVILLDDGRCHG